MDKNNIEELKNELKVINEFIKNCNQFDDLVNVASYSLVKRRSIILIKLKNLED